MLADEIVEAAQQAVKFGYGTVVLQGGEDYGITTSWMTDIIRQIKSETPLAVTLSLGERPDKDLAAWRAAGADRYLLRFENLGPQPVRGDSPAAGAIANATALPFCAVNKNRIRSRQRRDGGHSRPDLRQPGNDIALFRELDLDMIGIGPFIPHPATPLGTGMRFFPSVNGEQVPNTELMVYKTVALTRLVRPDANIPATTALATINKKKRPRTGPPARRERVHARTSRR